MKIYYEITSAGTGLLGQSWRGPVCGTGKRNKYYALSHDSRVNQNITNNEKEVTYKRCMRVLKIGDYKFYPDRGY